MAIAAVFVVCKGELPFLDEEGVLEVQQELVAERSELLAEVVE